MLIVRFLIIYISYKKWILFRLLKAGYKQDIKYEYKNFIFMI